MGGAKMQNNFVYVWRGDYSDGYLWYITHESGILIRIDVETGQVDYVQSLIKCGDAKGHIYHQLVCAEKNVFWAIPGMGDRLLQIDLLNNEQLAYDFPESEPQPNQVSKFTGCIKYGEKIFCFPGNAEYILSIDCRTGESECNRSVTNAIDDIQGEKLYSYFSWGTVREGNMVYAVGLKHNLLLELNLDTNEYRLTNLMNEEGVCGYRGVTVFNNLIFVTNRFFQVRIYNALTKQFIKRLETPNSYLMLRQYKDGVLLVPAKDAKYAFYDVKNDTINEVEYPLECQYIYKDEKKMLAKDIIETNDKYFIVSAFCNTLIIIDKNTKEVEFKEMFYGKSLLDFLLGAGNGVLQEGKNIVDFMKMDLEDFVSLLDSQ